MKYLLRGLQLALLLGSGLFQVTFVLPRLSYQQRGTKIKQWSLKLIAVFDLQLEIHGQIDTQAGNLLYAGNHISWLDIFALKSQFHSGFVAKSEIAGWPLVGRLCQGAGTFFINRQRIKDTKLVNEQISAAMRAGECISFFPEGTTSNGRQVLPFKGSLIQAVMNSEGTIQPFYLNYTLNGKQTDLAAYIDDISFEQSMHTLMKHSGLVFHLYYLPPISITGKTRAELTSELQHVIEQQHHAFMLQYADKQPMQLG
ncbi:lysophospholipid acyltransferase family protein [Chitinibacter tainanensis]|uniref:lysophospholipid acyltransferase family protein n=1 Tax=Chitinibacter tainanensis TaxID=230667 RepID=UPI0023560FCD|nr:lysophospholipid acyltransferase family protein [Chitinibacter tainanensis]